MGLISEFCFFSVQFTLEKKKHRKNSDKKTTKISEEVKITQKKRKHQKGGKIIYVSFHESLHLH